MITYYIDPSLAVNGTGTLQSPFNTWAGVPLAPGNVYKQKRGTQWPLLGTDVFPSIMSGTAGNITTCSTYYNADGTDDETQVLPVLKLRDTGGAALPGTLNSPRTFIKYERFDIRVNRAFAYSDTPVCYLGSDMEFSDCVIRCPLAVFYGEKANNVKILNNTIVGSTSTDTSCSMNVIAITGPVGMTGHKIIGNTIFVGEGGNSASHGIRIETYSPSVRITDLVVSDNTVTTLSGVLTTNPYKRGISISNTDSAKITDNTVTHLLTGIFCNSSTEAKIRKNTCNSNANFGIQITTNTNGFIIESNVCRWNGANQESTYWWGRGLELSGAGITNSCTNHIIRYNDCSYNYNYGGPADNATEGVGIGLDDAANYCIVHDNTMYRNQGNGLQTNGVNAALGDTGGNIIFDNIFYENAVESFMGLRSGSPVQATGAAQLVFAYTYGAKSVAFGNVFVGGIGGIFQVATSSSIDISRNTFIDCTSYAIAVPGTADVGENTYRSTIPYPVIQAGTLPNLVPLGCGINGDCVKDANDKVDLPVGKFRLGDTVRKCKGSQWHGKVVGWYSTTLTPEGYAVESSTECGSVQIYPAAALEYYEPGV